MQNLTPVVRAVRRGGPDALYTATAAVLAWLLTGGNVEQTLNALLAGDFRAAIRPLLLVAVSALIAAGHKWATARTEPPLRR